MRFLPFVAFGTTGYPEDVARRLRALNMAAWIVSAVTFGFAIAQFADPSPDVWKIATANAVTSGLLAAVPLLHRFGAYAAPLGFAAVAYPAIFVICGLMGTDNGMQMQYLATAALMVLFLGTDRFFLVAAFAALSCVLIIALEVVVPPNTGLQSQTIVFGNFLAGTFFSCFVLFLIVYYAIREAVRAQKEAQRAHARSELLLANILPASVAARLKEDTPSVIADRYDDASILFADMAGFTARASHADPVDLVHFLNRVFTQFDHLVELHGLEKIKTTGDAYMVVAGVPNTRPDHADSLARLAIAMRDASRQMRDSAGRSVPIRIGIGTGPVVAGIVGTRKFFYDVWGDAVNVAARMESTGLAGEIQISPATRDRLRGRFKLVARKSIAVKGKGRMRTWILRGA